MTGLSENTWVLVGGRLGRIVRVGKLRGAAGYWVEDDTGDPGSTTSMPTFTPDWCAKPAVVGVSVCPTPGVGCCGRVHVSAAMLARLPKAVAA